MCWSWWCGGLAGPERCLPPLPPFSTILKLRASSVLVPALPVQVLHHYQLTLPLGSEVTAVCPGVSLAVPGSSGLSLSSSVSAEECCVFPVTLVSLDGSPPLVPAPPETSVPRRVHVLSLLVHRPGPFLPCHIRELSGEPHISNDVLKCPRFWNLHGERSTFPLRCRSELAWGASSEPSIDGNPDNRSPLVSG